MISRLSQVQDWSATAKQANWSASRMATRCDVSPSTLKRYFLKNMGKTPKVWLSEQRQLHALEIIQSGLSVKETAFKLGYEHPNQFSREFRQYWGHCPASTAQTHPFAERK
jgi:AraC-like DNA-binding protein